MVDKPLPTEIMSAKEFKNIRDELQLSVTDMTKMLNIVNARTVRRWEDDETPVSGPVTVLMHAMKDVTGLTEYLTKRARKREP